MKTVLFLLSLSMAEVFAPAASGAERESLSGTLDVPRTKHTAITWGRDPFVPLIRLGSPYELKLSAIFYNKEKPSAIINGVIVYAGSVVNGQKVIDIAKTHVILQGETGKVRLELADEPVK